ncbi:MAG: hypothetical protein J6X86_08145 [Bacteroidales bacterium]|nr:hypothetical protein [Bacteroidales bacterium]
MKKILLIIVLFCLYETVNAQQWQLKTYADSKALQFRNEVTNVGFIGGDVDKFYLLRRYPKNEAPYLVAYDSNLVELWHKDLASGDGVLYYGGFLNEKTIDLLVTERDDNSFKAFHESHSVLVPNAEVTRTELFAISGSDSKKMKMTLRSSQSGEWTGTMYVLPGKDNAEANVVLYDTELDEMWSMEVALGTVDDYFVSDSGEVVFAGFFKEDGILETYLEFTVLDGEREHTYTSSINEGDLYRIDIVKYENGKIYCTGLMKGEKQDDKDDWSSGFFSLVFDTKKKEVEYFEKQAFTKTDICRLCNVADRSRLRVLTTDKMAYADSRFDKGGATVAYERYYNVYVNGGYSQTVMEGILTFRIDNQGHLRWNNISRRQLTNADFGKLTTTRMIESDNKQYLVTYDMPSNAKVSPEKPVRIVGSADPKLHMMILSFDISGAATRNYLTMPSKTMAVGAPHRLNDGRYLMLFAGNRHSSAAVLYND